MKESGPDEIAPARLLPCDVPGGFQTMALVINRLSEETLALGWREPAPNLCYFLEGDTR